MARLWNKFDGEPFLDNPHLFFTNPRRRRPARKKKGSNMARRRDSKGRFLKAGASRKRKHTRRRHHAARRRTTMRSVRVVRHPALVNPRRRRHYRTNPRRRHYRRHNPAFGNIFSGSTVKMVLYAGLGLAGTPFIEGFVASSLPQIYPTDPTARKVVSYGVKIGSAWALSWGVGKIAGREAGRMVLIGGLASVAVVALRDLGVFNLLTPGTTVTGTSKYLGSQALIGRGAGRYPGFGSALTNSTAHRLNPAARF